MESILCLAEIEQKILFYLSYPSILSYALTCKKNSYILRDEPFWLRKMRNVFELKGLTDRQLHYMLKDTKYGLTYLLMSKNHPYQFKEKTEFSYACDSRSLLIYYFGTDFPDENLETFYVFGKICRNEAIDKDFGYLGDVSLENV